MVRIYPLSMMQWCLQNPRFVAYHRITDRTRKVLKGFFGRPCAAKWVQNGPKLQKVESQIDHSMITHSQKHWLVGGFSPPLGKMMEFVSWDDDIPNMMGKKDSCSKPPSSWSFIIIFVVSLVSGWMITMCLSGLKKNHNVFDYQCSFNHVSNECDGRARQTPQPREKGHPAAGQPWPGMIPPVNKRTHPAGKGVSCWLR